MIKILILFLNLISISHSSEYDDYIDYEDVEYTDHEVIENIYLKHPIYYAEIVINPYEEIYGQDLYYYEED